MPRIRTVKPEFWTDAKTGNLSEFAKCLFIGLLNHADDYGVLQWAPEEWRIKIFPYHSDQSVGTVTAALMDELLPKGLLVCFSHCGDEGDDEPKQYLWIKTFNRHQVIKKPSLPLLKGWGRNDSPKSYATRLGASYVEFPSFASPTSDPPVTH